ncbi:flavin-containing monooxygenase FMO GS-OX-like 2 [Andrographis paniculata]|uniref:flavin-containing monooxygenase FMO GS-OX-like 2 n=1 Tax=Andrographis paniculata TaxID=175694 RepID=UPI0021E72AE7|nr:flavin-containing monooxygenase FMO GS-OX-like 2 [Andrographis paniculata]
MASPPLTVAVVGAGAAGLAAARALRMESHRVVVYEKSGHIGGTWVYDPRVESDPIGLDPDRETVHSSLYRSLRTNLPRQLMGFSDYPFPRGGNGDPRTFPGHEEVLRFLTGFAAHFGLSESIRLETEVVRVEQNKDNDGWVVESRRNGSNSNPSVEEVFDAVVICNGHHTRPRSASFPGMEKWPGKQIHSHNYRVPDPFQDQIVVIIGDGASAVDIALEISKVAKQVHLSSRNISKLNVVQVQVQDNIWQHSEIDYVDGNGQVFFQDKSCIPAADTILHCTGYKYHFPFLKTTDIITVDDNRVGPLYKHVFPPRLAPNLSFVGLTYWSPIFLMIDLQAKWVARVLSGKASLPPDEIMVADVEEHYRNMDIKGIPKRHTHCLYHQFEYLDWLATQVGLSGVDAQVRSTYENYYKFVVEKGEWPKREWEPN